MPIKTEFPPCLICHKPYTMHRTGENYKEQVITIESRCARCRVVHLWDRERQAHETISFDNGTTVYHLSQTEFIRNLIKSKQQEYKEGYETLTPILKDLVDTISTTYTKIYGNNNDYYLRDTVHSIVVSKVTTPEIMLEYKKIFLINENPTRINYQSISDFIQVYRKYL